MATARSLLVNHRWGLSFLLFPSPLLLSSTSFSDGGESWFVEQTCSVVILANLLRHLQGSEAAVQPSSPVHAALLAYLRQHARGGAIDRVLFDAAIDAVHAVLASCVNEAQRTQWVADRRRLIEESKEEETRRSHTPGQTIASAQHIDSRVPGLCLYAHIRSLRVPPFLSRVSSVFSSLVRSLSAFSFGSLVDQRKCGDADLGRGVAQFEDRAGVDEACLEQTRQQAEAIAQDGQVGEAARMRRSGCLTRTKDLSFCRRCCAHFPPSAVLVFIALCSARDRPLLVCLRSLSSVRFCRPRLVSSSTFFVRPCRTPSTLRSLRRSNTRTASCSRV